MNDMPGFGTECGVNMMDILLTEDVLEKLSYFIEAQKISRKKRQVKGISKAKEKGIRFGRQSVPLPDNFQKNTTVTK